MSETNEFTQHIADLYESLQYDGIKIFNEWERGFIESVHDQEFFPSPKQREIIQKLIDKL